MEVKSTHFEESWNDSRNLHEVKIFIPGVPRDSISLEVKGQEVSITAARNLMLEDDEEFIHREFAPTVDFKKSFLLPEELDLSSIEASCRNGVLLLSISRAPEKEARKIKVH
jgi:HSP20 family protein